MSLWILEQSKKYADNAVETYENMQGYIYGLTLSNNSVDADNDIDIAIGRARNDDNDYTMVLASAITKRSDAAWAVGTGNGGMDTGTKPNDGTLHIWLIRRSDTGVVDALFSVSATSPTMPTNYDQKRRIGSVLTGETTAPIRSFLQYGDYFYTGLTNDLNISTGFPTTPTLVTMTAPSGIVVNLVTTAYMQVSGTNPVQLLLYAGEDSTKMTALATFAATTDYIIELTGLIVPTNTSSQIYYNVAVANRVSTLAIRSYGWMDRRGK